MKSRICIFLLAITLVPNLTACGMSSDEGITKAEAETIALEHAGFTAEEVRGLLTDYEMDDSISKYEVKFYEGTQEYEYDIDAETGEILLIDKDTP